MDPKNATIFSEKNYSGFPDWKYDLPLKRLPYNFEVIGVSQQMDFINANKPNIILIGIFYVLFVHLGPKVMEKRKPFDLRKVLAAWNFAFGIFSTIGFWRMFPGFADVWWGSKNGPHELVCHRSNLSPQMAFWAFMFVYSKMAELGDTVFLVLRKKPVSFLHWFHHLSMLYMCFFLVGELEPVQRLTCVWNFGVHSIMYTYFGLMALKLKVPKKFSMCITLLQLTQFTHGLSYQLYTVRKYMKGENCFRSKTSIVANLICGFLYLTLFAHLFYKSYITKRKSVEEKKIK